MLNRRAPRCPRKLKLRKEAMLNKRDASKLNSNGYVLHQIRTEKLVASKKLFEAARSLKSLGDWRRGNVLIEKSEINHHKTQRKQISK